MHSTRTAVLAMLVVLLLPAPAVRAETAPPDRSKTAGPISAELAKKCRALAIKAHPNKPAGRAYAQAPGVNPLGSPPFAFDGISLRCGRGGEFTEREIASASPAAVLNSTMSVPSFFGP
jgi:hypothetical protein